MYIVSLLFTLSSTVLPARTKKEFSSAISFWSLEDKQKQELKEKVQTAIGYRFTCSGGDFSQTIQYDNGVNRFQYDTGVNNVFAPQSQLMLRSALVDQKVNTIDPSFYDCVYSTTLGQTIVERCYKDIGCCATTCCNNDDWKEKYGWAVALIVVFCVLVVIAVVISMIVWLINRSKDKKQKRLLEDAGLSRATSNMSLAQSTPNGYHFGTGPYQSPPGAGYRY